MRRIENMTDKWMKTAIICAIGGIISKSKDNRIMFCRETFYDAELEDLEINCEHLGKLELLQNKVTSHFTSYSDMT